MTVTIDLPLATMLKLQDQARATGKDVEALVVEAVEARVDHAPRGISPNPRLPDFIPGDEISAPCDLPRSSQPITVVAHPGQGRLPDLLQE